MEGEGALAAGPGAGAKRKPEEGGAGDNEGGGSGGGGKGGGGGPSVKKQKKQSKKDRKKGRGAEQDGRGGRRKPLKDMKFGGRVQKTVSLVAGYASARFNYHITRLEWGGEGCSKKEKKAHDAVRATTKRGSR